MANWIKKYAGVLAGLVEVLLYILPIISHGASYSTENELTGEIGMEVVRWHSCIAADLIVSPLAPLVILGIGLAVAAAVVNYRRTKEKAAGRYDKAGDVLLVASVFALAASWCAAQIGY